MLLISLRFCEPFFMCSAFLDLFIYSQLKTNYFVYGLGEICFLPFCKYCVVLVLHNTLINVISQSSIEAKFVFEFNNQICCLNLNFFLLNYLLKANELI